MGDQKGWVILAERYGGDTADPSDADLSRAVDELFDEDLEGMEEGDYEEHPDAWLRYGFDEGPMYIITGSRDETATLEKYADQDYEELLASLVVDVDRRTLLQLWKWLARGEVERIKSEYPECGW